MKQTAVDWLYVRMFEKKGIISKEEYDQAKEMEKEQTCGFVRDYIDDKCYASFKGCVQCSGSLEDYYDQTFNTNDK